MTEKKFSVDLSASNDSLIMSIGVESEFWCTFAHANLANKGSRYVKWFVPIDSDPCVIFS